MANIDQKMVGNSNKKPINNIDKKILETLNRKTAFRSKKNRKVCKEKKRFIGSAS